MELATSTVSSAAAQIFNTATNTFLEVGSLNTPRESAAAVVLPNGKTLIVGGATAGRQPTAASGGAFLCRRCDRGVYDEGTQAFTFAGSSATSGQMTIARSGPSATLIPVGSGTQWTARS